ncbi:tyrosine--tRNA ligase [Jonesia denitrificans]|uniref:Tyrosine--tRNA ligase n=1 Tax=Jonesia denitrificans (strain ATCC 14870 / DSM 20603 / BCRC 15368 / CIP 55.134 / JCM 11481 / NBRC 15587 / NCTC 10816 / Prevot 55134) TaxID=471856 RepID=C7R3R9_JONDD|nr:tyrosine--tRNA ligase [Jonesia denitrificans]ACV08776.1 tyrosyl-tRNA synthetase [Jonesia denitrificans DSM 20603]ASE09900.1 tyrosine--tRNA ligase [Jonesia denitrificans]QXB42238.1 tyrosine--tRNA ligase [Jonesia denitrificans]SQH20765.1 Tyrosine--tRNA ligase [Jonesia denitrificans]
MTNVLDELQWRGLVSQTTDIDALRAAFENGPVTYYCGFDPTAPSLHHGHLVQLVVLKHLQRAGHRPIALVGGATGLIGDPRMSGERVLNSKEVVAGWVERLRSQIERFLDFEGENAAMMVNNLDWHGQLSALDFLRDVGKHYRLGTMLAKDTVARRLASDEGISFTEFSYQILQGMDFLELNRRYGCTLQTGGNDQWGNLLSGVELIRKSDRVAVHALTTPLITKADGTKFGKSEGGAVWLDPAMMSPYAFYQFWVNSDDRDVIGWLKTFTFRSRQDIEALEQSLEERPQAREAQKALAFDVTAMVHGERAAQQAIAASAALFGRGAFEDLAESTLVAVTAELDIATISVGSPVVDALVEAGLVQSKAAARRAITEGGASINNVRVSDVEAVFTEDQLLHGAWVILRRGKKAVAAGRVATQE